MQTIWSNLPRIEKVDPRMLDRSISHDITVTNPAYGINIYKNAIKRDAGKNIIDQLENVLSNNHNFAWRSSLVNDKESDDAVRNCFDFKYKREHLGNSLEYNQTLYDIHKTVDNALSICLRDYESLWHLQMNYKEAFNFVKYLPGEYFKIHGDHGPYYTCTVSAVVYLNDDYSGGEIEFPRHNLKIKPDAGDIILFPSNFVYEHASCEVFEGTKYSVVIMTDYNDTFHKE